MKGMTFFVEGETMLKEMLVKAAVRGSLVVATFSIALCLFTWFLDLLFPGTGVAPTNTTWVTAAAEG